MTVLGHFGMAMGRALASLEERKASNTPSLSSTVGCVCVCDWVREKKRSRRAGRKDCTHSTVLSREIWSRKNTFCDAALSTCEEKTFSHNSWKVHQRGYGEQKHDYLSVNLLRSEPVCPDERPIKGESAPSACHHHEEH